MQAGKEITFFVATIFAPGLPLLSPVYVFSINAAFLKAALYEAPFLYSRHASLLDVNLLFPIELALRFSNAYVTVTEIF